MRVLLVEDDDILGDAVRAGLQQAGFTVDWLQDGRQADAALRDNTFDLLVLDLGLPGLEGLALLQGLRERGDSLPVLILTARDAVADRVRGLDAGADDYLVKPFDMDELAARLRALVRRQGGRARPRLRCGGVELDPAAHRVTLDGRPVALSPREFAVLQYLMEHAGSVVSRARLEQAIYGWSGEPDSNALEVFIHNLRKKLGAGFITTVRGVGYMVEP